eukprot:5496609-Amphidinium_carterae.1
MQQGMHGDVHASKHKLATRNSPRCPCQKADSLQEAIQIACELMVILVRGVGTERCKSESMAKGQ